MKFGRRQRSCCAYRFCRGDYVTIGDNVVLQYEHTVGERCRIAVNAPREVPILRGKVLERDGAQRPDCVLDTPRHCRRELPWDRSKAQALSAMRKLLYEMDGRDGDVQALRRQLNHIFPPQEAGKKQTPSNP